MTDHSITPRAERIADAVENHFDKATQTDIVKRLEGEDGVCSLTFKHDGSFKLTALNQELVAAAVGEDCSFKFAINELASVRSNSLSAEFVAGDGFHFSHSSVDCPTQGEAAV